MEREGEEEESDTRKGCFCRARKRERGRGTDVSFLLWSRPISLFLGSVAWIPVWIRESWARVTLDFLMWEGNLSRRRDIFSSLSFFFGFFTSRRLLCLVSIESRMIVIGIGVSIVLGFLVISFGIRLKNGFLNLNYSNYERLKSWRLIIMKRSRYLSFDIVKKAKKKKEILNLNVTWRMYLPMFKRILES